MRAVGNPRALIWAALLSAASLVQASDSAPAQVVKDATEKIQTLINAHHDEFVRDKTRFYGSVDEVVGPAFDIPYIAQITLGKAWRSATPDQRSRFQSAFKSTLIHAYSDTLLENSASAKIEWTRASGDEERTNARATVTRPNAPPVALGFDLHKTPAGGWLAYDVTVEGISLITNFRSQFASEIRRNGLDALIQRLESGKESAPEQSEQAPKKAN